MKVNKTKLAEIFGVSQKTLTEWQKDGLPVEDRGGKGQSNTYDTGECIAWRFNSLMTGDGFDFNKERARKEKESADKLEMENEVTRGALVLSTEVSQAWGEEFSRVKNKLMAAPPKIAPLMVAIKTPAEAQEIIKKVIIEALNELSKPD